MPSIPLHAGPTLTDSPPNKSNALPSLLHTPSGLALLELQGTFNVPPPAPTTTSTLIGRLVFPLYNPNLNGESDTKWMKRVYFYVGENQRMAGEVKKLVMPFAVVRKRGVSAATGGGEDVEMGGAGEEMEGSEEELEIVEVVRYKVVFSSRPEPVGGVGDEEGT